MHVVSGFISFLGIFVLSSLSAPTNRDWLCVWLWHSEEGVFTDCSVQLFAASTSNLFKIFALCAFCSLACFAIVVLEFGYTGNESLLISTLGAG